MTSREVTQELELFDQTMAILDQAPVKDEAHVQKRQQAILRLKNRVSLATATAALEDANKRNDSDDKRVAQRALSALLDTIPQDAAVDMLRKGLAHPDASTRASSVSKLAATPNLGLESIKDIVMRAMDVDTKVATVALEYVKGAINSGENPTSANVVQLLKDILAGRTPADRLSTESATGHLRIWEMSAELVKAKKSAYASNVSLMILETMLKALETPNDDVLFVLNALEIAASLPRDIYKGKTEKLVKTLLKYAETEEMVADDALRVLAGLHFSVENASTRQEFFSCLEHRMSQEYFSLGSLDVFALFAGANSETLTYTLDKQSRVSGRWLTLVARFAYDGNEVPRNVALDSLSTFLRGGSLLKEAWNPESTVFIDNPAMLANAETCAEKSWEFLKSELPMLLNSITAAIRSLHPQVQISAYQTIRILVSQNSKWGIAKVFEHIPKDLLLSGDMPSPNSNLQCAEARKYAIMSCAVKFLDEMEDAQLLKSIKQFTQASLSGTMYKLNTPSVDVATMRA